MKTGKCIISRRQFFLGLTAATVVAAVPAAPKRAKSQVYIPLSDFNAPNDGSADATPAVNDWITACINNGAMGYFGKGTFRLDTMPLARSEPARLVGLGGSSRMTTVLKNFIGANLTEASFRWLPGADGWSMDRIFFKNLKGGGCHIHAYADATQNGSMTNFSMEDLNLSLTDNVLPHHHIYIDGSLRNVYSIGARVNRLRHVYAFGADGASVVFKSCPGIDWDGGGIYPAGSQTAYAGSLLLTGTSVVPTSSPHIRIQTCNQVILNRTINARLNFNSIGSIGGISIQNIDGIDDVIVRGSKSGSIEGTWTNSYWTQ